MVSFSCTRPRAKHENWTKIGANLMETSLHVRWHLHAHMKNTRYKHTPFSALLPFSLLRCADRVCSCDGVKRFSYLYYLSAAWVGDGIVRRPRTVDRRSCVSAHHAQKPLSTYMMGKGTMRQARKDRNSSSRSRQTRAQHTKDPRSGASEKNDRQTQV